MLISRSVIALLMVVSFGLASWAEKPVVFDSKAHGYTLTLPAGWHSVPLKRADDVADVRFAWSDARLVGFYQVYEGAVTEDPQAWYELAKSQYKMATQTMGSVEKCDFTVLEKARIGGQQAWTFSFICAFKNGPPVTTRLFYTLRRTGQRMDVHELILTGETSVMSAAQNDVQALLDAVKFK